MPAFEAVKASYRALWAGMKISESKVPLADKAAQRILSGMARYKAVERTTGVPWWFIGLCHLREGNLSFETYLGNGQSIRRKTTIVPKGRGPFASFEAGAIDALTKMNFIGKPAAWWSLERIMYSLEGFNGYGYRSHGVNSPYLWAGTNRYSRGKYVRDGVFDSNVVDSQLGSMAVLARMCLLNAEVNEAVNGKPAAESAVRAPAKDAAVVLVAAETTTAAVGTQQGWAMADYVSAGLKVLAVAAAVYVALLVYRRLTRPKAPALPDDHPAVA